MRIIVVWGMPLIEQDAQTVCAIEKVDNMGKLGHDVHLISPSVPPQLYKYNRLKLPILLLFQISQCVQLLVHVIKIKPHIIHSSSALLLPPLIICKIFNIPHVVEVHGILSDDSKLVGVNKYIVAMMEFCEFMSYRYSERLLANSDGTKKDLIVKKKIPTEKIIIIPNGANTVLFKGEQISKESMMELDEDKQYIIFVGNLAPWQGLTCLIDSMQEIIKVNISARLLVVGDGILKNELMGRVKELDLESVVDFIGSVPYEDVPKYINASDICVAPFIKSRDNLMSPLKLFEYMACGKAIVTSNIRGARELIEEHDCGLLFTPDDSHELSKAILTILANKGIREKMGENGRLAVAANYTWESVAKKIETEYMKLV